MAGQQLWHLVYSLCYNTGYMSSHGTRGFTIIETMLFLAISAALATVILVSAGAAINIQRYRDATNSLVNFLQGEYNNAINVQNNRSDALSCSSSGIVNTGPGEAKGTSSCTVVGRFLKVSSDAKTITSSTVYSSADGSQAQNDKAALIASNLFISNLDTDLSYQLEWETRLVKAPPANAVFSPLNILIVRSPSSGAIRTYIGTGASDTPSSLVGVSATQTDTELCVDPSGLFTGPRGGALIVKNAANSSAVIPIEAGQC